MERLLKYALGFGCLGAVWWLRPASSVITIDSDGWLHGPNIQRIPAHPSWFTARLASGESLGIMAHYTNTGAGTAEVMARRRTRPLRDTDRRASWHLTIAGDGQVVQMVPCLAGAWHCRRGRVTAANGKRYRINRSVLGIELEGFGRAFPPAQVRAAAQVWAALVRHYSIAPDLAMLQHSEFDPKRRKDPGPVWMKQHAPRVLRYAYRQT